MAYIVTGEDILTHALELAGEATTNASPYFDRAKKYVMRYLADVAKMAPFPAALKSPNGILSVPAALEVTASGISGVTWTLSGSITESQTGRLVLLDAEGVPYRVSTHTGGTNILTCDATYTEDTLSGATSILKDQFILASDCLMVWYAWFRGPVNETRTITVVRGTASLNRFSTSDASQFALGVVYATDSVPTARLVPWVTEAATIEYVYSARPTELTFDSDADTDTPWLAVDDRYVIAEMAAARVMLDKRDTRADSLFLQARNHVREMSQQQCGMDLIEPRPATPEVK